MIDAFFVPKRPGEYEPTGHVVGPWSPDHMHAGPPSALLARAITEQTAGAGVVPDSALLTRMTVEILQPVPVAPVHIAVEVVRPGRRVALVAASLSVDGQVVLLARGWLMRQSATPVPDTRLEPAPVAAPFETLQPEGWNPGYLQAIDWGWVEGQFETPGPATAWTRSRRPLGQGRELTGGERAILVADSGSGLSAVASPQKLIFARTELTVHLTRVPQGESVWMRSETFLDSEGVGLATTVLGDAQGSVGIASQSLFLAAVP